MPYGIAGQKAPKWNHIKWINSSGKEIESIHLEDFKNKFKILYCFQDWCPGCHSSGLPTLQKLNEHFKDKVALLAIQTVFEGHQTNTFDKLRVNQLKYNVQIPFGHDIGDGKVSEIMEKYKTGGTPWFIIIDPNDNVIFNDFHISAKKTIEVLDQLINQFNENYPFP